MNQNKRLKGTKQLVMDIFSEHPDWNAPKIYERYLVLIGDAKKAVTLNAIQKHLEEIKFRYKEVENSGLDQEWHLGLLRNQEFIKNNPGFRIDPPALPYIRKLQEILILKNNKFISQRTTDQTVITARQAFWIGQFYAWHGDAGAFNLLIKKSDEFWSALYFASANYARHEIIASIQKTEFNTISFDGMFSANQAIFGPAFEKLDANLDELQAYFSQNPNGVKKASKLYPRFFDSFKRKVNK